MNEIEYLKSFIQCIKKEQIQFTKTRIDLNRFGAVPLLYNFYCGDVAEYSICHGVLMMNINQPISKSGFFVIGNRGRNLLSFISLPTLSRSTMLTNDAPDDIVIMELEGSLSLIRNSDGNKSDASTIHNIALMSLFKEMREWAHTNQTTVGANTTL